MIIVSARTGLYFYGVCNTAISEPISEPIFFCMVVSFYLNPTRINYYTHVLNADSV